MQQNKTIKELIKDYKQLPYPGIIYIEGAKKDNYEEAAFWVLSSKEKKEQDSVETKYGEVPESLAQFEVAYFSGVGIFQDIIDNKFDHNELLTTDDTDVLLGAIEHYFEYDDFQD
ncbi:MULTISPECIES: hypothetical protein [Capnocytophaga]|jgi:hypothetical protein|uniref:hypothetical protein n=1 Tax=Capnocytophaga TaxID=1016 RepID=UPI00020C5D41|nr:MULTISPECIES: hypothetical protein [unclassified Capnocytophaga]KHE70474.1 hypothetical protein HMPREF9074_07663 [Capnocytophaga sp. oral taxon 329 str. F0087]QGS18871.1 hypothetical protein FOC45_11560 [Capnocytophaga sp. FDAARGOS_737]